MKKILFSLGLLGLGLISFCSAYNNFDGDYEQLNSSNSYTVSVNAKECVSISVSRNFTYIDGNNSGSFTSTTHNFICFNYGGTLTTSYTNSNTNVYIFDISDFVDSFNSSLNCDYSSYESQIESLSGSLSTCQGMYDRLDSDYDLLEGNYNTCTSQLSSCLQNGGSSGSGIVNWSSLYINNNQVFGNENIFINIPSEYHYSYNSVGDNFTIEVIGLVQDTEYLSGVINKLNYIPTTEDFSNVFSNFGLFGGLLVVCLFVILVFYFIKKIFS